MHIGQKVVCIKGYTSIEGLELIEGKTYIIEKMSGCKCELMVFVGFYTNLTFTICENCKTKVGDPGEWWHYGSRFVPLDEQKEHNEAVENLLKELELSPNLN